MNRDNQYRTKIEIDARRRTVGQLYLSGKMQTEIAVQLGVNQAQISRDLKWLREQWLASSLVDINEAKSKELAKIDVLEIEYWDAWRRSVGERIRESTKATGKFRNDPSDIEKTIHKDFMIGDSRFLQGVQWCIDKRCKILGLDAPQLVNVSWQDEIVDLLKSGTIEPDQVQRDFGELAFDLFKRAGISVVTND